ncbi:related to MRPL16 - mitochondrial ribosomal protein, large subunit [Melanopsichium pennsylvanicum]|uniref:Related to MRPL16 - mitochondrial ribosomal protein, large subunit n=2 Tax=Melanopsichium pennsylvanicum TaxID=63383 RepID=A0AAJ5C787_9BASI|nr:related to MRPL16-mitochondrial ribosomal protein, large subunit [Melanopsichium pennsylvanicum 4]SNX86657.1 related to MRPL16 - mitochondrial ribosomal protein, large subunit [Melanopsichium pennsylvanicum]
MLPSLAAAFGKLSFNTTASAAAASAGPSRLSAASSIRSLHMASSVRPSIRSVAFIPSNVLSSALGGVRHKGNLAPRRTKYRKAHKITIPFNTGGSIKGTTVQEGAYGIRLLAPARLSAKQLVAAETALKRKLKVVKGAQVFLRVFPDTPVCIKGNETRMGKGKGTFEYWACRANMGKVIFEIGGPVEIRPEVAKEALRLASAKLPVPTEFVTTASKPRIGNKIVEHPTAATSATVGGVSVADEASAVASS